MPLSLSRSRTLALTLSLAFLAPISLFAEHARVVVSAAKDHQLFLYDLDLRTGELRPAGKENLPGAPGPQWLRGNRLYVAARSAESVATYQIGRSGELSHLGTKRIDSNAAYIALDRTGKWLLAASYSGGKVSSHDIRDDGTVGETISTIETHRCAHAILADQANRFVLVPHTCPNAVYQFRFDEKTGKLSANDPLIVNPAAGLEPRHLAFHPSVDVIYFDDEKGSSVTAYHYDAERGVLKPFQTVSTLPEGFSAQNSCADIEITKDGKFVYASNRGHDSIAGFSVDPSNGKLTSIGQFSTGKTPRSFNLSPDERFVVAAGQRSNDLTTYRRDPKTGRLEKLAVYKTGRNPSWVQFIPLELEKKTAPRKELRARGDARINDPNGNWPRFRGAQATGVAREDPRLPDRWSKTENIRWKTEIPGWGWSSPIVYGNRAFVTSVTSESDYDKPKAGLYLGGGRRKPPKGIHRWLTHCVDVDTGKILWTREAHRGQPEAPRHPKSTYASETPVTDGERVYVLFGDVGLYAYNFEGELVWKQQIKTEETFYGYGAAASPVVHGDQVIIVYDNQKESFIESFDSTTGKPRWRTLRNEKSTWATPFVWVTEERTEIVVAGKRKIRSYDLQGKVLWELAGRMSNLVIPSPFASGGMVYVASGYIGDKHRPGYAIRPGAKGDITLSKGETSNEFIRWYQPLISPYNTTPIVYRGHFYTIHDRGFITCHDALTGEEVYGKTRLPFQSSFTSSPWAYNGKIFCLTEQGTTHVIRAGPKFELLHSNELDELSMASPAVSRGRVFLRTASNLYCIEKETSK